MTDFSLFKDFKYIQWGPTLFLGLLRSIAAGIVWTIFAILVGQTDDALAVMLLFPVWYFVAAIPVGLIAYTLSSSGVPFAGFVAFSISLAIVLGDPLVYILSKIRPGVVPVQNFGFANFRLLILVLHPARMGGYTPPNKVW